ncbi:MAG TPA: response regulator transcription factor [Gaiellaceae bacterium]|nr:response regulator transcription factor [Gaiellaceae bacterium]
MGRANAGRRPIVIADPDEGARATLANLLRAAGYTVLDVATGEEAVQQARKRLPALLILEVPLGGLSGYEVCRTLREEHGEELPIIFLSGVRSEPHDRVAGLLMGADDYLGKPYAPDELLARVRRLVRKSRGNSSRYQLTPREVEVLELLAHGLSPEEIAARLVISVKTVGTHIEHIFRKLGVRTRAQAVGVAYREGFAESPK